MFDATQQCDSPPLLQCDTVDLGVLLLFTAAVYIVKCLRGEHIDTVHPLGAIKQPAEVASITCSPSEVCHQQSELI